MTLTRNVFLVLLAVVLFLVALVLILVDESPDPQVQAGLLYGGLASFAAGHL